MWPTLVSGQRYLATNLLTPCAGDVMVFRNPKNSEQILVKKVIKKEHDGYVVSGERIGSTGSESFGIVHRQLVIGKLLTSSLMKFSKGRGAPL